MKILIIEDLPDHINFVDVGDIENPNFMPACTNRLVFDYWARCKGLRKDIEWSIAQGGWVWKREMFDKIVNKKSK